MIESAFGKSFISNPDLVNRLRLDVLNRDSLFGGGAIGRTSTNERFV